MRSDSFLEKSKPFFPSFTFFVKYIWNIPAVAIGDFVNFIDITSVWMPGSVRHCKNSNSKEAMAPGLTDVT